MRRRFAARSRELLLVAAIGSALLLIALLPAPAWLKALALLPLVLILPGYAAAFFLPATIRRGEAVIYVVALSVGASALGGLVVQAFLPLDETVWAVWLISVTVLGIAAALGRGGERPPEEFHPRARRQRVHPLSALAFIAAVAIGGWAIAIATEGAHDQEDRSHFSSLWLAPQSPAARPDGGVWTVGVANHEGGESTYLLRVSRGSRLVRDWRIQLGQEQGWTARLDRSAVAGSGPLVASLYLDGALYRQVALELGGAA